MAVLAWLAGPPVRAFGAPEVEYEPPVQLWACNGPVLEVLRRMPWRFVSSGPVGLDWALLPQVLREVPQAGRRRARRELPELLRRAEEWVIEELAEQRRKQAKR